MRRELRRKTLEILTFIAQAEEDSVEQAGKGQPGI